MQLNNFVRHVPLLVIEFLYKPSFHLLGEDGLCRLWDGDSSLCFATITQSHQASSCDLFCLKHILSNIYIRVDTDGFRCTSFLN